MQWFESRCHLEVSKEKQHIYYSIGADHVIDYKEKINFSDEVTKITQKKGVDVIFDPVMSGHYFNEVIHFCDGLL